MAIIVDHLDRSLETLRSAYLMLEKAEKGSIDYEIYRNAVIKGYELSLETAGKLLKKSLKSFFATSQAVDALTFKEIFRYGAKHGILSIEEVERWFEYRDNRNTTAHDYGAEFAEKTLKLIPDFINDAVKVAEKIKKMT